MQPKLLSRGRRIRSLLTTIWLGVAACSAKRTQSPSLTTPVAPSPASRYTEADSAAVLAAVVHEMLFFDGTRATVERKFSDGHAIPDSEPRVFVRIGAMPRGAWAAPTVQRLRSWQWFVDGRAVDSTRALAGLEDRPAARWRKPIPIKLLMHVEFRGDTAFVAEDWIWEYCETEPRSMSVLRLKMHLFEQTPSGWQQSSVRSGALVDLMCSSPTRRGAAKPL